MALPALAPTAIGLAGGAILRTDLQAYVESASDIEQGLFAEKIFPVYPVAARDGQYLTATITDTGVASGVGQARAPGTEFATYFRQQNSRNYSCINYGAEAIVPQEVEDYLSDFGFDTQAEHTKLTVRGIKLFQEQRVQNVLMNSANFTATAANVAYLTANLATATPILDLITARNANLKNGVQPDTVVMSLNVASYIIQTTNFLNFYKGYAISATNIPNIDAIGVMLKTLGIQNFYVPWAAINTAALGATASLSPIWSDTYIWMGKCNGGPSSIGGAGRLFTWSKHGGLYNIVSYWDQRIRSTRIQVDQFVTEVVLGVEAQGSTAGVSTFGQLITTGYTGS